MPNIAAQFGESATCISTKMKINRKPQAVIALFQDLGTAPVIDEKLMDALLFWLRVELLLPCVT
jgi:pyrroline-5-carboxylate reductase